MEKKGRKICDTLKEVRKDIAQKNDIPYETHECHFEGECNGTCPRCEAEVRYPETELKKKKKKGLQVALAGISAGLIAVAGSGCRAAEKADDFIDWLFHKPVGPFQQTVGDVPMPEPETETEVIELAGDIDVNVTEEDIDMGLVPAETESGEVEEE